MCVAPGSLGVLGPANDSVGDLASLDLESALDQTSDQSTDDSTVLEAGVDGPTVRRQLQSLETMYSEVGYRGSCDIQLRHKCATFHSTFHNVNAPRNFRCDIAQLFLSTGRPDCQSHFNVATFVSSPAFSYSYISPLQ